MTDTHRRDPRDEAADQIQAVRDYWAPTQPPALVLIDGLATNTLHRLIDHRTMTRETS